MILIPIWENLLKTVKLYIPATLARLNWFGVMRMDLSRSAASPNGRATRSAGTYRWNRADRTTPDRNMGPVTLIFLPGFFRKRIRRLGSVSRLAEAEKPVKLKNPVFPVKPTDQQSGGAAAQKAGQNADEQRRPVQGHAVEDALRVEQTGAHHKRCQPVILHATLRERGRQGDGSVRAQEGETVRDQFLRSIWSSLQHDGGDGPISDYPLDKENIFNDLVLAQIVLC